MGMIHPVYQRIAELWHKQKRMALTDDEVRELNQCLEWNIHRCWKVANLEDLSYLASATGDVAWQHQICSKIDKIQEGR